MDSDDLRQQLIFEALRASATMPLPTNPSYLRRRLIARASLGVRRWLQREGRRQRTQCSFEALAEEYCPEDAALRELVRIVHGADFAEEVTLTPESAGLRTISTNR